MTENRLTPQSQCAFADRLDEIVGRLAKDVLSVKQRMNERENLMSSQTVWDIYQCVDAAIIEMGKAAAQSARLSYEAGHHKYSAGLESELLDAFEHNFSLGFERLSAIHSSEAQAIARGLQNQKMLESIEHLEVGKRAQTNGQLELRQYFQTLKRGRKRWYEYIPLIAQIAMWLSKGH